MKKFVLLSITHLVFAAVGFAAGIYTLPILTAPAAPSTVEMETAGSQVEFQGELRRDLPGSDFLHWGEGTLKLGSKFISLQGKIAPGPDYKLYLSPQFVQTEAEFNAVKSQMVQVGDIKTFNNFIVQVPENIDIKAYNSAIVWCESFGEFITATQYQ